MLKTYVFRHLQPALPRCRVSTTTMMTTMTTKSRMNTARRNALVAILIQKQFLAQRKIFLWAP